MNNTSSRDHPAKLDEAHIVVSSIFVVLIILLTISGNLLVILSFKRFLRIRHVTNYFVVSLAVTDILVTVIAMPVWLAFIWVPTLFHEKPLLQMIWTMTDIMVSVASIWHLTFVSIDRYLCITEPLQYHCRMTSKRAIAIITAIWLYSILAAILAPMSWHWESYTLVVTVLNYAVPVIIIIFSYVAIFRVAQYQAKQIELNVNGKSRRFSLVAEVKAAKTLGVVIGAFIVCWSPFFALNLSYYICHCAPSPVVVSVAKWMHYGNSMLNPLIYGLMNKDFKYSFKKLLSPYLPFLRKGFSRQSMESRPPSGIVTKLEGEQVYLVSSI